MIEEPLMIEEIILFFLIFCIMMLVIGVIMGDKGDPRRKS